MKITDFLGETTEYDKKQAVEYRKVKSWLKSVSAFANTSGGTLIFGITDDERVIGLDDIKSDSEFISQKIKERISPFPEVVMKLHKAEDGKELLLLQIPAGAETPYYYTGDGVTEAYIRIGNESVVADATELKRLVMRGKNSSYDSLISPYDYDDFSFSKLRERYKSWTGKVCLKKVSNPLVLKMHKAILQMPVHCLQIILRFVGLVFFVQDGMGWIKAVVKLMH